MRFCKTALTDKTKLKQLEINFWYIDAYKLC